MVKNVWLGSARVQPMLVAVAVAVRRVTVASKLTDGSYE
jgi:hypothetical protein